MNQNAPMLAPDRILKIIRQTPRVPAPSQVVSKILSLTRDPSCNFSTVAELIQRDSALTVELLRQANSALFAGAKVTSSVKDACVRLGLKRVRTVAINDHIVSGMGKACPPGFHPHSYWQAALATSVAARQLARELLPAELDDASTAGLLVDVGIGLLAYGVPDVYQDVLGQMSGCLSADIEAIELRIVGITHSEVAAAVLEDWKLDAHLIEAVRLHHRGKSDDAESVPSQLSQIVGAAATCSQIALGGSDMEMVERLFDQIGALHPKPDELVGRLLDDLVNHIQKAAEDLTVELGETEQMATNFERAAKNLPGVGATMSFRPMGRHLFEDDSP